MTRSVSGHLRVIRHSALTVLCVTLLIFIALVPTIYSQNKALSPNVPVLVGVSTPAFLLAASGGVLPLNYSEVSIDTTDGLTRLLKVYGPCHFLYSLYLFAYFGIMIVAIVYSAAHHQLTTSKQAAILLSLVFFNILVWFVEQLVLESFEFLTVWMCRRPQKRRLSASTPPVSTTPISTRS